MTKRIEKVNELIKREINRFIIRNFELPEGTFLTITRVKTSRDLGEAKIFCSIFPKDKIKEVFLNLKRNRRLIQYYLNRRLVMKSIPKIKFLIDVGEERVEKVENLINKIKKI